MKRIILIIGALLFGLATQAQSVSYTCRYWFDQNHAQAVTTTFGENGWEAELDVGQLSDGLHALHLHVLASDTVSVLGIENDSLYYVTDTAIMKWSAPQSYLFLKINDTPAGELAYHYWFDQDHTAMQSGALGNGQLLLDVADLEAGLHALHVMLKGTEYSALQTYLFLKTDAWEQGTPNYVYHCWFDEDFDHQQSDSLGIGQLLLDVADLEDGLHTVHVMLQGSTLTATQSYMFMKVASFATDSVDMSHLAYHCWFDQDFEHQQIDSLGDGHLLLDVADLEDGLHTVHVMLEGSTYTATQSYMFMKMAVEDPSAELQYVCWFDQDYSSAQIGPLGSGLFELEVGDLSNGIHTVNVQLDNGTRTAPQCYLFYKRPLGGYGVARWEYWLNDDFANRIINDLSPTHDTLEIISLLPVGHPDIRSSCFHFHPNGEEPYINAKNQISFRFWDSEMRFIDKSAFYVDEQVQQDIVASVFERNTTETFTAPRDNQITWYKLDAGVGDSLAFEADKACTMQLFAPSGEEVFNVSGSELVVLGGLHIWEDGTYYLAVHDQTGSGETVSVTYQYLHKYAVLAYDVHLVGNGGCSTITFQGNGFNSLLDAYLVNAQNDIIHRLDIGHESNTTTTVTFNFYEVNLGVYDAVFQFYDETVRINGALEVQEPVVIVLTSSVSYPAQFLRNTPCTYTYTISNNGNMSAYAVPIYAYISTATLEGVSHLEFEGLNLPSIISDMDLDSLSSQDLEYLKEWAENMGDDHYFFKLRTVDEETGDSIVVRSNFFYTNLAPFESKTLLLKITADEVLDVWMGVPNDTVQPVTFMPNRGIREQYCCIQDKISCVLDIVCGTMDLVDLVMSITGTPASAALGAANCICSGISTMNTQASKVYCEEEGPGNFWDNLHSFLDKNSFVGWAASCIKSLIPGGRVADIADAVGNLSSYISLFAHPVTVTDCAVAFLGKKQNCPPIPPNGGESTPVNSLDPNDIHGYLSESGSHYMRQEIQNVQYEIEFENDTTLATAAAHTIIVRDTLDATKFDLNSLAARSVTIGDKRLELNGEQTFARTLDLRPELYVIAQVEQDYDPATGIIQWTIQSLDPMTMEPTDNPNQGVLPVNYNGNGVGFIDYGINLKEAFADGTEISNRAGIIFDNEEVIMTPTWTNIVDAVKPTSHIEEVTPIADSLNFSFVSTDNRSGVWYHTLYYRNDSTDQQWQVRKAQIFEDSFMLKLDDLQTTEYLVMAVDSAGNREDKLMNAEYVFSLDSIVYYTLAVESQGCGEVSGAGIYLAGSHVVIEAVPDEGCQFEQWNDGITDNPRTIELVQDTTFVAQFSFGQTEATQTTNLTSGWNWWSTYVEADDLFNQLKTGLGDNAQQIKSSTTFVNYFNGMWIGGLSSISNESCYLIKATNACTLEMTGNPAAPADHPITINPNWNWIGYPNTSAMTVANVFSNFSPANGDQVKSQNAFSTYYGGMWVGGLSTINPGMGLLYKSNSTSAKTLVYSEANRSVGLVENVTNEDNHWTADYHAYPGNMTVMAVIELDDEGLSGEHYEIAAFADGECRGSARLMYVAPINRYVAFLTIVGDEASELRFSLYDSETGVVETQDVASLRYETNATMGSLETPYVVRFRSTTGMDEWSTNVNIFPNPVNRGERFSLGMTDDMKGGVQVEIVNALGMVVETQNLASPQSITAPMVAGVYTLRITVEGKGTCFRKLVVK